MKFTCSVDIQEDINKVIEMWQNPDNLKEWQDGFQSVEHLTGEYNKVGSTYEMTYVMRGKPFKLHETILVHDLPQEYKGLYVHEKMSNTMQNHFTEVDGKTRYTAHIEYTILKGFLIKLMAMLMPGMFKKNTQKWMDQFRDFVEREKAKT